MISDRSTGLSSSAQYQTSLMRDRSFRWSMLNRTCSGRAAEYNRIGNETRPKLKKPFQTVAGICSLFFLDAHMQEVFPREACVDDKTLHWSEDPSGATKSRPTV